MNTNIHSMILLLNPNQTICWDPIEAKPRCVFSPFELFTKCTCHLSHVSCLTSPVSCLLYHFSYITSPVSSLSSPVSWILSHGQLSNVSRLLTPVSLLPCLFSCFHSLVYFLTPLSLVSCLLFPVSSLPFLVSCRLSPLSCSCLLSLVSCFLSLESCLLFHVS